MKIVVFGATGRTGVPLCERALSRGHEVVAHVRSPEKLPTKLREMERLTLVTGDVYRGEGIESAVAGVDAVASVLGQTDDGPDDLLAVAGEHVTAAMVEAGVSRYVTLVGAGVRTEGESVSLGGRAMGLLLRLFARDVLADAAEHVRRVRETDLEWTVLRVPRLADGNPDGEYRIGDIELGFEAIDRADVAACILDVIEDGTYVRELPKVGSA